LWTFRVKLFVLPLQELGRFKPETISMAYAMAKSLDIELSENVAQDGKNFWLTVVIVTVYATAVSCGGNWVSTRLLLAYAGVLSCLLSIPATFGLLSICGLPFVNLCWLTPFLVLGKSK
jgi:hypothetical protein